MIPSLDLQKINSSEAPQQPAKHQDASSARSASIFDRDAFSQFKTDNLVPKDDGSLPELIKVREEAIVYRERKEQKLLAQ